MGVRLLQLQRVVRHGEGRRMTLLVLLSPLYSSYATNPDRTRLAKYFLNAIFEIIHLPAPSVLVNLKGRDEGAAPTIVEMPRLISATVSTPPTIEGHSRPESKFYRHLRNNLPPAPADTSACMHTGGSLSLKERRGARSNAPIMFDERPRPISAIVSALGHSEDSRPESNS